MLVEDFLHGQGDDVEEDGGSLQTATIAPPRPSLHRMGRGRILSLCALAVDSASACLAMREIREVPGRRQCGGLMQTSHWRLAMTHRHGNASLARGFKHRSSSNSVHYCFKRLAEKSFPTKRSCFRNSWVAAFN